MTVWIGEDSRDLHAMACARVARLTGIAIALLASSSGAQQRITVSANVHVSSARSQVTHDDVLIAADPSDASHLLACSMFDPEDGVFGPMTTVYASFDGGRTWSHVLTDSTADTEDPACVFGPNGTAYFGHIQPMRIYRSTDAGKTWSAATFPVGPDQEDRDFLSVDNTGGKFHGRVYAYAQMAAPHLDGKVLPKGITLWRSLDSGKSFEGPVQRFPDDFSTAFHPGNSAVLSDGTWMAVVNQLNISKRHDGIGGARLGPPSEP